MDKSFNLCQNERKKKTNLSFGRLGGSGAMDTQRGKNASFVKGEAKIFKEIRTKAFVIRRSRNASIMFAKMPR